jgi:hypothetical protein
VRPVVREPEAFAEQQRPALGGPVELQQRELAEPLGHLRRRTASSSRSFWVEAAAVVEAEEVVVGVQQVVAVAEVVRSWPRAQPR